MFIIATFRLHKKKLPPPYGNSNRKKNKNKTLATQEQGNNSGSSYQSL
jgi:hypothetical protein